MTVHRRSFRAVASARLAEDDAPSESLARLLSGEDSAVMAVRNLVLAEIDLVPAATGGDALSAADPLVASVRRHGVLEPILVRRLGPRRYEVISGARRVLAARAAGLDRIPAVNRNLDAAVAIEVRAASRAAEGRERSHLGARPPRDFARQELAIRSQLSVLRARREQLAAESRVLLDLIDGYERWLSILGFADPSARTAVDKCGRGA